MAIVELLGDMQPSAFIEDYYQRLPLAMPDRARHLHSLGTWETVESILRTSEPDVVIARAGKLWEGTLPEKPIPEAPGPSIAEVRALHAAGQTVLIRHAERRHQGLAELAASFEKDFDAPIDIHLYCTPAQEHGFGWHYDAEDVFVIQTEGSKHYALRKNTVHPLPLKETLPDDMAFEREVTPTFECTLLPGDWLYIPAGYWHVARAAEDSISLAVGILSASVIELLDFLRRDLLAAPLWRQRLPITGLVSPWTEEEVRDRHRRLLAELADDLAGRLREERFLLSFLARNRQRSSQSRRA